MLVNKITTDFVTQVFDTDKKQFIDQYFTASDQCDYEDLNSDPVSPSLLEANNKEVYLPFGMEQPK